MATKEKNKFGGLIVTILTSAVICTLVDHNFSQRYKFLLLPPQPSTLTRQMDNFKLFHFFLLQHSANLLMRMDTLRILQSQTSGTSLWTLPTPGIRLVFQTNGQHCDLKMNPSIMKLWKHHIKCKWCSCQA